MAEEKRPEPTFYQAYTYPQRMEPGVSLEVKRSLEYRPYYVDKSNLAVLSKMTQAELQDRRKGSATLEKALFDEVLAAVQKWEEQAANTMLLDRAIEYVKTPQVKHTANEWKRQKQGFWEISNLVYCMRYQITQETSGNHKGQWLVTWGIAVNRPKHPESEKHYYSGETMVVEQKKKYYNAEADAQHYIQGRFDTYAHLFKELSPPIPDNFKRHFTINGVLLPGYAVAPPERTPQEVADALMEGIDDNDLLGLLPPAEAPQKKAAPISEKQAEQTKADRTDTAKPKEQPKPAKPTKQSAPKKKPPNKKKSAPVR